MAENGTPARLVPVRPGQKHDVVKQPDTNGVRGAAHDWIAEHPADKPFDPSVGSEPLGAQPPTPTGAATDLTETPAPSGEPKPASAAAPSTEAPGATQPSAAVPPASAPPAGGALPELPGKTPAAKTEDAPGARVEKPAADTPGGPLLFDRTKSYMLADGAPAWTGDQIVDGLRERETFRTQVEAAKPVFELFETDAATTVKNWKPVVDRIKEDPAAAWLANQALFGEPGLQRYLHTCAAHYGGLTPEERERYDTEIPAATTAAKTEPTAAALPKEVQDRLNRYESFMAEVMTRDYRAAQERELAGVIAAYPFLQQNKPVVLEILQTAKLLHASDQSKGIVDAAQQMRATLELLRINHERNVTPPVAADETPAPPPVPALNGGGGANPTGTRRQSHPGPTVFKDVIEARKAHMKEYPE